MSPRFRKAGYVLCISGILGCAHRTARTPEPTPPAPPAPAPAPSEVPAPPPVETPPPKPERNPCLLGGGDPVRFETLRVVLVDGVDPSHAPSATNDSEALVFRQLYETLVQVDCGGRVSPGLARSWQSSEQGKVWEFTLRDSAYFWDGTVVNAAAVLKSWTAARSLSFVPGRPAPWSWIRSDAVRVVDSRHLTVRLTSAPSNAVAFFSHPVLAVTKPATDWAIGSGGYRVTSGSVSFSFGLEPNPHHPQVGRGRSPLEFSVRNGSDPRDVMTKADLILLETESSVSYAKGLGDFQTFPLHWSRTYVLVSPYNTGARALSSAWSELRTQLSEHIVDADARPASGFSSTTTPCTLPRSIVPSDGPAREAVVLDPEGGHQLVYESGDPNARSIAERLVAVALDPATAANDALLYGALEGPASGTNPVAVELAPATYASSIRGGDRWAYLVALHRTHTDPCLNAAAFAGSMRWLASRVNAARSQSGSALTMAGVPLLTARNHVAMRRGVAGVLQEWDGTLQLSGAGRTGVDAP